MKKTGTSKISVYRSYGSYDLNPYTPEILYNKGDKKENVNQRLVDALNTTAKELIIKFEEMIKEAEGYLAKIKKRIRYSIY